MKTWILAVVWWVIAILVHELGHWLAYRSLGKNVSIRVRFFGLEVGSGSDLMLLRPPQAAWVLTSGILAGLVVVKFAFQGMLPLAAYFVTCSYDIGILMNVQQAFSKHGNISLLESEKREITAIERATHKRLLFVCSCNLNRSPTFERVVKARFPEYEVKSAGTMYGYPNQVNRELVDWADAIYVMVAEHREFFEEHYPDAVGKVITVGVEDRFNPDEPELVELIKKWSEGRFRRQKT